MSVKCELQAREEKAKYCKAKCVLPKARFIVLFLGSARLETLREMPTWFTMKTSAHAVCFETRVGVTLVTVNLSVILCVLEAKNSPHPLRSARPKPPNTTQTAATAHAVR